MPWENLPASTNKRVFQVVELEMREGIDGFMEDIRDHYVRLQALGDSGPVPETAN